MWLRLVNFLPQILGAFLILVLGLLLAYSLAELARKLVRLTRIDQFLQNLDVVKSIEKNGVRIRFDEFIAWLVKWFILILTLITVSDSLGLPQITAFLEEVVRYIPRVITATVILAIGFTAASFIQRLVVQAVTASRIPTSSAGFLGTIAKWAIVLFSFMAALIQLGIAAVLLQTLFTGLVAMLALAGGLAFGLGGRDHANQWIGRISSEIREENREQRRE